MSTAMLLLLLLLSLLLLLLPLPVSPFSIGDSRRVTSIPPCNALAPCRIHVSRRMLLRVSWC